MLKCENVLSANRKWSVKCYRGVLMFNKMAKMDANMNQYQRN